MAKNKKKYVEYPWFDIQTHMSGPNLEIFGLDSHSHLFSEDDYCTLRHVLYLTLFGVSFGFGWMRYYER